MHSYGQEDDNKRSKVFYSVAYNVTSGHSKIPLIGFVNLAKGQHTGAEIGFVNTTIGKFVGGQVGFVNIVGNNVNGAQIGFVNTTSGSVTGSQIGFVNTATGKTRGGQIGFVNTNAGSLQGVQIGFINTGIKSIKGSQIGFVNTARKKIIGSQIGFINYVDEIEGGVPLGFLSFVRRGGYKAIELSTSEIYPVNIAFKTGVRIFYTYVKGGYNPNAYNQFGLGAGLGGQLRLGHNFYYNPEAETMSSLSRYWGDHTVSVINSLRYGIGNGIELAAGPAITWRRDVVRGDEGNLSWTVRERLNNSNDLIIGLRLSAAVTF